MFSNYVNLYLNIVVVISLLMGLADVADAGTCWVKRMESGECKQPLSRNVSKEDCCSAGPNVGFTDKEMNEFEYFFAMALGDGTSCTPCTATCENAKCGVGKRCIMKKGQPMCICSPMCKVSSVNNNKKQLNSVNLKNRKLKMKSSNRTVLDVSSDNQRKANASDQLINANTAVVIKKSDKVFISPSITISNKLSKSNRTSVSNRDFNIKHSLNSTIHKKRHQKKKQRVKNNKNENTTSESIVKEGSIDWGRRIRTGFIGYDLPYPPNQIQPDQRGPYYNPVCGTDGRTYKTECQLKKRACRQETTSLTVAYQGQCQTSCSQVKCPPKQYCLEDQNLMPHCVTCSIKCPPFEESAKMTVTNPSKMVCGTDGITYRNLCEIKKAACFLGRSIPVAYRGPCKELANCSNIKCKDRQICLNDLITHRPRCVSCSFKCPRRRQPQGRHGGHIKLCGLNNITYYSWCHMMKDSCETGFFIDTKHNGPCTLAKTNLTISNVSKSPLER